MQVNKELGLPSSYRVMAEASGHIRTKMVRVVRLGSSTAGHVTVYAAWYADGGWREINQDAALRLVRDIFDMVG